MSFILCLNSTNVVSSSNTSFRYNFLTGNLKLKNAEMCISTLTMPYAFFNVSSYYSNKTFSITFPTAASTATPTAITASQPVAGITTLPDGFYSVTDIQNYIQQTCINNGWYLVDGAGNYVFYTYLTYNATYYSVQLVQSLVPTALPAGWSNPAGLTFNAVSRTPTLSLAATGSISKILGFPAGVSYPAAPSATAYSYIGTLTPVGSTINSLVARCNIISNEVVIPSDILDGFPINATFGSNITYEPSFEKWVTIRDGTYSSLTFTISDQNLNDVNSQDPNCSITLMIRQKKI